MMRWAHTTFIIFGDRTSFQEFGSNFVLLYYYLSLIIFNFTIVYASSCKEWEEVVEDQDQLLQDGPHPHALRRADSHLGGRAWWEDF